MIRHARGPDVRTVVVLGDRGRLQGVAQGGIGDTFLNDLRSCSPDTTSTPEPPIFKLGQLAPLPSAQGTGLGAALHDALMDEVTSPSLLLTHPGADAAVRLYERRGWTIVGRVDFAKLHPRLILLRP